MKRFIVLFATVAVACGVNYDGIRVKFGWSNVLEDKEYFFSLPRTVDLATDAGWRSVQRPIGVARAELSMYCRSDDVNVCPLYDLSNIIAGVQVAIPAEAVKSVPMNPAENFIQWSNVTIGKTQQNYLTSSIYFVSEESLKAGVRAKGTAVIQGNSVWVDKPSSADKLLRIPLNETDLAKTPYTKQNCVPNMGGHYFYDMTPKLACTNLFTWFTLVKERQVIGAGFTVMGKTKKVGARDWFETPNVQAQQIIVATPPKCLSEWVQKYGLITLHVYFLNEPWTIRCTDEDSVQPMSLVKRLLLASIGTASKIYDEAKKLLGG